MGLPPPQVKHWQERHPTGAGLQKKPLKKGLLALKLQFTLDMTNSKYIGEKVLILYEVLYNEIEYFQQIRIQCACDVQYSTGYFIASWVWSRAFAGITCETCAVNKMAAVKLPLTFLSFSSSRIGSIEKRII